MTYIQQKTKKVSNSIPQNGRRTITKRGKKGMPFVKKTAVPFDRVTVLIFPVIIFPIQRNIKKRLSNKTFRFFVYRLQRRSFSGLKKIEAVLFEVVSQRIVSSTTIQYRRFLDVRASSGLDFLLLEVHRQLTEDLRSADLIIALCPSELQSAALLKQVKFL